MSASIKAQKYTHKSKIAIILVNWNGWKDTIECLESIFKNESSKFITIVCDNNSSNESWEKIIDWANGKAHSQPASKNMSSYSMPPSQKPIPMKIIDNHVVTHDAHNANLILIQTGDNLGFAGGNNVGIRYALEHSCCDYYWLLNNDTVINHDAIGNLLQHLNESTNIGMCGTRIHFYHQPDKIQALGGAKYNEWTGTSKCIGNYEDVDYSLPLNEIKNKIDFVAGASLVVSRPYVEKIGLMNEEYFLFYEEIDWATRNQNNFSLDYCPSAIAFHKEGGSRGLDSFPGIRNNISEYYMCRSKLLFTKNFFPLKLPTVYAYTFIKIIRCAIRRDFKKSFIMLRLLLGLSEKY